MEVAKWCVREIWESELIIEDTLQLGHGALDCSILRGSLNIELFFNVILRESIVLLDILFSDELISKREVFIGSGLGQLISFLKVP